MPACLNFAMENRAASASLLSVASARFWRVCGGSHGKLVLAERLASLRHELAELGAFLGF
jgi:hypothetical protein